MKYLRSYWTMTIVFCVASTLVAVNVGRAATATGSLVVSASVSNACSVGASSLSFGTVTSGVALNGTGTISVTCTSGAPYTVDLGVGLNGSGPNRRLSTGGATPSFLTYFLYQDAAHTITWGTAAMGGTESGTGTGAAQSLPVFGQVPAQTAGAGSYTDSVTVTVAF